MSLLSLRWLIAALALLACAPAGAQSVVTSDGPGQVSVTVYRNPARSGDGGDAMDLAWLGGYALITETRRITLPAGESVIRFEGVAGGIIPQSAIVTGFPNGIVERNRDAYLLSPATLIDRSLGRRVHIRRTDRTTGRVSESDAVILSGADGAVVLQTPAGYEALRCTGQAESLRHDGVPADLAVRPTLSVRARASAAVEATVTLSYLSTGFDWQADYVAHLSDDESQVELFAWLTLANGDETGFRDAGTQAVAGQPNWQRVPPQPREGGPLTLRCWPQARTHEIPLQEFQRMAIEGLIDEEGGSDIVVTAGRRQEYLQDVPMAVAAVSADMIALEESLGDLRLYRIPEPVTVAARSQKQVALLTRPRVEVEIVHRRSLQPLQIDGQPVEATRYIVTRNREDRGLGLALPAGGLVLFAGSRERPVLIGEGIVEDSPVGGDVEIATGTAPGIRAMMTRPDPADPYARLLTVTNDRDRPVRFEGELGALPRQIRTTARLRERDGQAVWAVTVPANGSVELRLRTPPES